MSEFRYIFIVGAYRTGTDLLRNIFNATENIAICGETNFFETPRTLNILWQNIAKPTTGRLTSDEKNYRWGLTLGSRQKLARAGDISTDTGVKQVVDYIYDCAHELSRAFWTHWLPK